MIITLYIIIFAIIINIIITKMTQRNPFIINSQYVSAEYFCDREIETKELKDNILNGRIVIAENIDCFVFFGIFSV